MGNVPATLELLLPESRRESRLEEWRAMNMTEVLARFSIDDEMMMLAMRPTEMASSSQVLGLQAVKCDGCNSEAFPGSLRRRAIAFANGLIGPGSRIQGQRFTSKSKQDQDLNLCQACFQSVVAEELAAAASFTALDPSVPYLPFDSSRSILPCRRTTEARGVTFSFLKAYLVRLGMDPGLKNSAPEAPPLNSYMMLDRVKADTAQWNCSMVEMIDAIHRLSTSSGPQLAKMVDSEGGGNSSNEDDDTDSGWETVDDDESEDGLEEEGGVLLGDQMSDGSYFPSPVAGREGRLAPSHFLSYSWAYPLLDICDIIMGQVKSGEDITVWMDIFCINQHQGAKTQEDLGRLRDCIRSVNEVLFVVDVNGTAMTRIWCLYEVMVALQEEAHLHCVFMGASRNVFQAAMVALMVLAGRFDDVDVRDASATVASDKPLILSQIEENPGTEVMNAAVRAALKDAALREFEKTRHAFGSSWWGPDTFPQDVVDGLVSEIRDNGGWQVCLLSSNVHVILASSLQEING